MTLLSEILEIKGGKIVTKDDDFKEQEHPRDEDGKFSTKESRAEGSARRKKIRESLLKEVLASNPGFSSSGKRPKISDLKNALQGLKKKDNPEVKAFEKGIQEKPKKEEKKGKLSESELRIVAYNMLGELKSSGKWNRGVDVEEMESDAEHASLSLRYFGDWKIPDGEEDDGDYDWKEPTSATRKTMNDIAEKIAKDNPNAKVSWNAEEKYWISISVRNK